MCCSVWIWMALFSLCLSEIPHYNLVLVFRCSQLLFVFSLFCIVSTTWIHKAASAPLRSLKAYTDLPNLCSTEIWLNCFWVRWSGDIQVALLILLCVNIPTLPTIINLLNELKSENMSPSRSSHQFNLHNRRKRERETTSTLARWHQGRNKLHTHRTMRFSKRSKQVDEDGHGNHQKSDATWRDTVTRNMLFCISHAQDRPIETRKMYCKNYVAISRILNISKTMFNIIQQTILSCSGQELRET